MKRWTLAMLAIALVSLAAHLALLQRTQPQVEEAKRAEAARLLLASHGEPRSPHWPTVRKHHLEREPACVFCGSTVGVQVHHIRKFSKHPELELDDGTDGTGTDGNLVTLCGPEHHNCHLIFGHLLSFLSDNPDVRKDAAWFRAKVKAAKEAQ